MFYSIYIITIPILLLISPLIAVSILFFTWRKSGQDAKSNEPLIPRYQPPDDMNVLLADVILNEKLTKRSVGAAVTELTIKGYLRINESPKNNGGANNHDFELVLIKSPSDLPRELDLVLSLFFGEAHKVGDRVKKSELSQNFITEGAVSFLAIYSGERCAELGYFFDIPAKSTLKTLKLAFLSVTTGLILIIVSFASYVSISSLQTAVNITKDAEAIMALINTHVFVGGLGLILSFIILRQGSKTMPARTSKGVETLNHLLGIREYIELAEAERLNYLQGTSTAERRTNSSTDQLHIYEELLPYAILFGLEKSWSSEYQGIHDAGFDFNPTLNMLNYISE